MVPKNIKSSKLRFREGKAFSYLSLSNFLLIMAGQLFSPLKLLLWVCVNLLNRFADIRLTCYDLQQSVIRYLWNVLL